MSGTKETHETKAYLVWLNKQKKRAEQLVKRVDFIQDVLNARKINNIDINGFKNKVQVKEWIKNRNDEEFQNSINQIAIKYDLTEQWTDLVRVYVIHNKMDYPRNLPILTSKNINTGQPILLLQIDKNMTSEDVKAVWSEIKKLQVDILRREKDKQQPYENLERDKMAYLLWKDNIPYKDIADKLNEKFDTNYADYEISKLIERYQKYLDTNQA